MMSILSRFSALAPCVALLAAAACGGDSNSTYVDDFVVPPGVSLQVERPTNATAGEAAPPGAAGAAGMENGAATDSAGGTPEAVPGTTPVATPAAADTAAPPSGAP